MSIPVQNSALLLIDFINDFRFARGNRLQQHTDSILPNVTRLKAFAKQEHIPVIYINDHYGLWQADAQTLMSHCRNERSTPIIDAMKPDDDDYFLIKPQHSAFFETPLHSLLTDLHKTNIIIAGIAGDICILFSAKDAHMYNYSLTIPQDCVVSNETKANEYALYLMRKVMNADTTPFNMHH